MDKIQSLFPDMKSAGDLPTPSDKIADELQAIVDDIRNGKRMPRYLDVLYMGHDSRITVVGCGDQTDYERMTLLYVGQQIVLHDFLHRET
jgi:hypothetical protein